MFLAKKDIRRCALERCLSTYCSSPNITCYRRIGENGGFFCTLPMLTPNINHALRNQKNRRVLLTIGSIRPQAIPRDASSGVKPSPEKNFNGTLPIATSYTNEPLLALNYKKYNLLQTIIICFIVGPKTTSLPTLSTMRQRDIPITNTTYGKFLELNKKVKQTTVQTRFYFSKDQKPSYLPKALAGADCNAQAMQVGLSSNLKPRLSSSEQNQSKAVPALGLHLSDSVCLSADGLGFAALRTTNHKTKTALFTHNIIGSLMPGNCAGSSVKGRYKATLYAGKWTQTYSNKKSKNAIVQTISTYKTSPTYKPAAGGGFFKQSNKTFLSYWLLPLIGLVAFRADGAGLDIDRYAITGPIVPSSMNLNRSQATVQNISYNTQTPIGETDLLMQSKSEGTWFVQKPYSQRRPFNQLYKLLLREQKTTFLGAVGGTKPNVWELRPGAAINGKQKSAGWRTPTAVGTTCFSIDLATNNTKFIYTVSKFALKTAYSSNSSAAKPQNLLNNKSGATRPPTTVSSFNRSSLTRLKPLIATDYRFDNNLDTTRQKSQNANVRTSENSYLNGTYLKLLGKTYYTQTPVTNYKEVIVFLDNLIKNVNWNTLNKGFTDQDNGALYNSNSIKGLLVLSDLHNRNVSLFTGGVNNSYIARNLNLQTLPKADSLVLANKTNFNILQFFKENNLLPGSVQSVGRTKSETTGATGFMAKQNNKKVYVQAYNAGFLSNEMVLRPPTGDLQTKAQHKPNQSIYNMLLLNKLATDQPVDYSFVQKSSSYNSKINYGFIKMHSPILTASYYTNRVMPLDNTLVSPKDAKFSGSAVGKIVKPKSDYNSPADFFGVPTAKTILRSFNYPTMAHLTSLNKKSLDVPISGTQTSLGNMSIPESTPSGLDKINNIFCTYIKYIRNNINKFVKLSKSNNMVRAYSNRSVPIAHYQEDHILDNRILSNYIPKNRLQLDNIQNQTGQHVQNFIKTGDPSLETRQTIFQNAIPIVLQHKKFLVLKTSLAHKEQYVGLFLHAKTNLPGSLVLNNLPKRSPLTIPALEELNKYKKDMQKKRKAKKQRLESRRKKKRKRFYPRPNWLRLRLGVALYKTKTHKSGLFSLPSQENKSNQYLVNFDNTFMTKKLANSQNLRTLKDIKNTRGFFNGSVPRAKGFARTFGAQKKSFTCLNNYMQTLTSGYKSLSLTSPSFKSKNNGLPTTSNRKTYQIAANTTIYNNIVYNLWLASGVGDKKSTGKNLLDSSSTTRTGQLKKQNYVVCAVGANLKIAPYSYKNKLLMLGLTSGKTNKQLLITLKNTASYAPFEEKSNQNPSKKDINKNTLRDFWVWLYNITNTNTINKQLNLLNSFAIPIVSIGKLKTLPLQTEGTVGLTSSQSAMDGLPTMQSSTLARTTNLETKNLENTTLVDQIDSTLPTVNNNQKGKSTIVQTKNLQTRKVGTDFTGNFRKSYKTILNNFNQKSVNRVNWSLNKTNLWSSTNQRINFWSTQKLRNQSKNNKTKYIEKQLKKQLDNLFTNLKFKWFCGIAANNTVKPFAFDGFGSKSLEPNQATLLGDFESLKQNLATSQKHKLWVPISQKMHQKEIKLAYVTSGFNRKLNNGQVAFDGRQTPMGAPQLYGPKVPLSKIFSLKFSNLLLPSLATKSKNSNELKQKLYGSMYKVKTNLRQEGFITKPSNISWFDNVAFDRFSFKGNLEPDQKTNKSNNLKPFYFNLDKLQNASLVFAGGDSIQSKWSKPETGTLSSDLRILSQTGKAKHSLSHNPSLEAMPITSSLVGAFLLHFCALISLISISQIRCFIKFHFILLHKLTGGKLLSNIYLQLINMRALVFAFVSQKLLGAGNKKLITSLAKGKTNPLWMRKNLKSSSKNLNSNYSIYTAAGGSYLLESRLASYGASPQPPTKLIGLQRSFSTERTGTPSKGARTDKSKIRNLLDKYFAGSKTFALIPFDGSYKNTSKDKKKSNGKRKLSYFLQNPLNFKTSALETRELLAVDKKQVTQKSQQDVKSLYKFSNFLIRFLLFFFKRSALLKQNANGKANPPRLQASPGNQKPKLNAPTTGQTLFYKYLLTTQSKIYQNLLQQQTKTITYNALGTIKKGTYNTSLQIVDTFEYFLRIIYGFFEKPAELTMDWIAYAFLVEWSSDLLTFTPENKDKQNWVAFSKVAKQNQPLFPILSFINLSLQKNTNLLFNTSAFGTISAIVTAQSFSLFNSQFFYKRILYLNDMFIEVFNRPDTDLIYRQTKGTLFWDIWSDILIKAADQYNINVPSLSNIKEEQNLLIDRFLSESSTYDSTGRVPSKVVPAGSKRPNRGFLGLLSSQSLKTKRKTVRPVDGFGFLMPVPLKKGLELGLGRSPISPRYKTTAKLNQSYALNKGAKSILGQKAPYITEFVTYQSKETDLFLDYHPPKSFSHLSSIQYYSLVQQPIGTLVCQIYSGILNKQISKNILVIGSTLNSKTYTAFERMQKTLLIQALAGETEIKIITDNAHRYAIVNRGFAVGIKLLKDVFEALSLNTPCLFLLEDIHLIGERRPLLISDNGDSLGDDMGKATEVAFGAQRNGDAVHEKNQILYQFNRHGIAHYQKPFKGDFSLSIPTNHFSFDFFFKNRSSNFASTPTNPLAYSINFADLTSGGLSQNTSSEKDSGNKNSEKLISKRGRRQLKVGVSKSQNHLSSSLQLTQNQLLSPPSTSPFTVLLLKEQKKLKPKKIVKELPWVGLPSEQFALLPRVSYSVRAKVAALADLSFSNMSAKFDMITDLLVIIDSVRGNRGFVVFATTHLPHILDPALRRPGRLDETISIPTLSNLWNRWEFTKAPQPVIGFDLTAYPQISNGSLLSLCSNPTNKTINGLALNGSGVTGSFYKNVFSSYISNSILGYHGTLDYLDFLNFDLLPNQKTNILSPILTALSISPTANTQSSNKNSIATFSIQSKAHVQNSIRRRRDKTTNIAYYQMGRKVIRNWVTTKQTLATIAQKPTNVLPVRSLPIWNLFNFSPIYNNSKTYESSTLLTETKEFLSTDIQFKSIYASTHVIKNTLIGLISGKFSELFAFKTVPMVRSVEWSNPPTTTLNVFTGGKNQSLAQNQSNSQPVSYNKKTPKLAYANLLSTYGASDSENSFLAAIGQKPTKQFIAFNKNTSAMSRSNGSYGSLTNSADGGQGLYGQIPGRTYGSQKQTTLYGIDQTWRAAMSLALSFVQKRYLYNKNLIIPKLLNFLDYSVVEEAPSPPSANILIPAKRYENYKKVLKDNIERKVSLDINTKIETHIKQSFIQSIYKIKSKLNKPLTEGKGLIGNNPDDFFETNKIAQFRNLASLETTQNTLFMQTTTIPASPSWYYQNKVLKRHKNYLTNQWWNGQLIEHNAETLFLSDIDWRYTFYSPEVRSGLDTKNGSSIFNLTKMAIKPEQLKKYAGLFLHAKTNPPTTSVTTVGANSISTYDKKSSIQDILLDFPDSDQHYNPKHRRWLLNSGYWSSWFDFDKKLQTDILNHFIFECFITSYNILNKNRELLDYSVTKYMQTGLIKEINMIHILQKF